MPDYSNPYGHSDQDLNLPDPDLDTGAMLDSQVQKAQEQLLALRRQADQIEKQKRELEDLSQRQEELERGRNDMIEKLSRSLTIIEREAVEAERRVDHLRNTHEAFSQHLDLLESINPKTWSPTDLGKELSKAQSDVEDARAVYSKNRAKIGLEAAESSGGNASIASYVGETGEAQGFLYWLNAGFAFTLPLLVLGLIALIVYFIHSAK
ncbi:MAG: hypothetical protein ABIT76_08990 [Chthoniobacterales bacterium]